MATGTVFSEIRTVLGLREIRSLLRTRRARLMVALLAILYAIVSIVVGLMVQFGPTGAPFGVHTTLLAHASDWWNYPMVIVTAPNWILYLPFLPTITMVLVSVGVGIALGASGLLLAATIRVRRDSQGRSGLAAGVAPAVAGIATLGACCCTSCTATLSVGVIASVSGANLFSLLENNWYLDIFQLAIVGVSLVALERGLRTASNACVPAKALDRRYVAGTALRIALLIAGMTWSLAMFVEWSEVSPWTAPASLWYHWIFEHQLLSLTALFVALFPPDAARLVSRWQRSWRGWIVRVALLVAGVTWGLGVPAFAVNWGLGGFVNELLGVLGMPAAWGAVAPDAVLGPALYFHWIFQHAMLGVIAILIAVAPEPALKPLLWTVPRAEPSRPVGPPQESV